MTSLDREITVDAGTRALALTGPLPVFLLRVPEGARYRFWGNEHGIATLGMSAPPVRTRLLIPATHCDPTVNLHEAYHAVVDDGLPKIWPDPGRYRPARTASEQHIPISNRRSA